MKMKDLVLVSVDDHVVEPPDMFTKHLSAEHLAMSPQCATDRQGREVWIFEDRKIAIAGLNAVVGRPREQYGLSPQGLGDLREGTYSAARRIEDMNVNGILGSVNFPSFPGFAGQAFWQASDRRNAARVIRAYNDWHIDEWCNSAPGRFIPNALLPLWDMELTVAEIQRVVDKSCYSVCFPDNPAAHGLPSLHNRTWEPLWRLCNDAGVLLNCHMGTGYLPPHASRESPIDAWLTAFPMSIAGSAADWLTASFWFHYPDLKVVLAESGIGWVPYFLERADLAFQQHSAWTRANYGGLLPSEVFRNHIVTSFIDDRFGLENSGQIGTDMIVWECDYPHADCTWPNTPEVLWESLAELPDDAIRKITHENAMRLWRYDPFAVMPTEQCTVSALRRHARHVDIDPIPLRDSDNATGPLGRRITSGDILEPSER